MSFIYIQLLRVEYGYKYTPLKIEHSIYRDTSKTGVYAPMGNNPISYNDPEGDFFFAPILIGAAIGAAVAGGTTIATNAIAGNNLFQGFGKAVAFGAVGGAIGGGVGAAFAGSAFGQSAGFSILNNIASNAATSAAFGQNITLGSLAGGVAGGLVGSQLPGFTGVKGGSLANGLAEIGHKGLSGAITGAVSGGIGAAFDGQNIGDGIGRGAGYGAIGGGVQAGLNILTMGTTYVPGREYGDFGSVKPVYRRGTFLTRFLFEGRGVTIGRNLITNEMGEDMASYYGIDRNKYNEFLRAHETGHFDQQRKFGFGRFYGRTGREYIKYGLGNVYGTPGTLEFQADQYAQRLLGYKF